MDHKIQYSDIWVSTAWALLKKMTGPADRWRAEFCWSTGSYMDHRTSSYTGPLAVTVVMDHRTSSSTGPLAVSVVMDHQTSSYTGPLAVTVIMDHRTNSSTGPLEVSVVKDHWTSSSSGPQAVSVVKDHRTSSSTGPLAVSEVMDHWTSSSTQFQWSWTTGPAVLHTVSVVMDHRTSRNFKPPLFILFLLSLLHQRCRRHHGLAPFRMPSSDNHQEAEQLHLHPARTDNSSGTRKGRQVCIPLKNYIYDRINNRQLFRN